MSAPGRASCSATRVTLARWAGPSTPSAGRSGGCCCGRTGDCLRCPAGAGRSPLSSRPGTRPQPCRTCFRRWSASCSRATSSSSWTTTREMRTSSVARACGARVLPAPPLPAGWVGKPHACATGAAATSAPTLVFVDADVRPGPRLLDGLAAAVAGAPGAVVSVQPWHDAERPGERLTALGERRRPDGQRGVHGRRIRRRRRPWRSGRCSALRACRLRARRRARRTGRPVEPDRGHRARPRRRGEPAVQRPPRRDVPHVPARARRGRRRVVAHARRRHRGDAVVGAARRRRLGRRRSPGDRSRAGSPTRSAPCRSGCSAGGPDGSDRCWRRCTRCSCWPSSAWSPARRGVGSAGGPRGRAGPCGRHDQRTSRRILPTLASASM